MTVCRKKPPARSCKAPSPAPLDPVVFTALRRDYHTRWGVALVAVDPEGRPVLGGRRGITEAQRECWRRLVWEAWRWGEPSLALAPDGTLACGVPLMRNQTLLGGLVTGGLSATACARGTADGAPNAAEDLLDRVLARDLTNRAHLLRQREAARRERERAEAIHAIKESGYDTLREAYLREEPALLATVKRGDRRAAREILNRLLVGIYHLAGNRLDLLKSLTLELVVMLYRAAVEAGARPTELLGMNYDGLRTLSEIEDEEQLCHWLISLLERLMDGIRAYRDHPNTVLLQQALRHMSLHLDRATELLRRNALSIAAIARQCGFRDPSHFGKVFLRRRGMTPLAYRHRHTAPTAPHELTRK